MEVIWEMISLTYEIIADTNHTVIYPQQAL